MAIPASKETPKVRRAACRTSDWIDDRKIDVVRYQTWLGKKTQLMGKSSRNGHHEIQNKPETVIRRTSDETRRERTNPVAVFNARTSCQRARLWPAARPVPHVVPVGYMLGSQYMALYILDDQGK
jgi:hypothetical protein